jgi:hypothetical protein
MLPYLALVQKYILFDKLFQWFMFPGVANVCGFEVSEDYLTLFFISSFRLAVKGNAEALPF